MGDSVRFDELLEPKPKSRDLEVAHFDRASLVLLIQIPLRADSEQLTYLFELTICLQVVQAGHQGFVPLVELERKILADSSTFVD
jgi:hypothetical protein